MEKRGSQILSKLCNYVAFSNHPQQSKRKQCRQAILKKVELSSGRRFLYPFKIFCYQSLKSCMQSFSMRPEVFQQCDHWRKRTTLADGSSPDVIKDLYDGRLWKEFMTVDGLPFLIAPYTYALALNIDWFQPYQHTVMSVGVIYLTILNLPRHLRYKRCNILLIGIIPGPSEPTHDINTYLYPLVTELQHFWKGVLLNVRSGLFTKQVKIRCALLCVACDLPAGHKVCGFMSHSAALGCSKCYKKFPGTISNMCYAGFDRSLWTPRNDLRHRMEVSKIMKCQTPTARAKCESKFGCRYSVLLELPYFDASRMLAIDPMHNLFLGTGKHMINVWLQKGLLSCKKFYEIQLCVDSMLVPSSVGRIPRKIETGFSGFKADQFKNWINLYSVPAMFDILPTQDLECWRHFVLASRLLCQQQISITDLKLADSLLLNFCKRVECLYGEDVISPNMHLHCHLSDVLLDFGPVQEFWLFSFECYNGILGKHPNNNKIIELQLMKRFLNDNIADQFMESPPDEFSQEFKPLLNQVSQIDKIKGSVAETIVSNAPLLPLKHSKGVLSAEEIEVLRQLFLTLENDNLPTFHVTINSVYQRFSSITINGKLYNSSGCNWTSSPYIVQAAWNENLFGQMPTSMPQLHSTSNLRPVNVHYYMKVFFFNDDPLHAQVNQQPAASSLLFAKVSWLYPHPHRLKIGKPAEIWCRSQYENFGLHSFVPVKYIRRRCAHCVKRYEDEDVRVIVSLVE